MDKPVCFCRFILQLLFKTFDLRLKLLYLFCLILRSAGSLLGSRMVVRISNAWILLVYNGFF